MKRCECGQYPDVCARYGHAGEPDEPPTIPDRFGAVFPDGAVYDATEGARLFDQDAEQRARAMAVKIGGRPVRIRTTIEWLPDA
jgi:hypothetical protein